MAVLREDIVKITYEVDSGPLSEVGTAVDSVINSADNAVKQVESAGTKAVQETAEAASSAAESVTTAADTASDAVSAVETAGNAASEAVSGVAEAVEGEYVHAMNYFGDAAEEAGSRGSVVMEELRSVIAGPVKSAAEQLGTAIKSRAVTAVQNLGDKIKSLPKAALDRIVGGVKKIGAALKALPMAALKKLAEGLKTAGSAAMDAAGKVAAFTGKAALAGIGATAAAAAGGIALVTKAALEQGAAMEQNIGGVETLFGAGGKNVAEYAESVGKSVHEVSGEYYALKSAENIVLNNARNAWKTAGLSANEYMETVTGFSASLVSSLGGDTLKASKAADVAITDMADNANKMGTSMESIQNAYAGFAKGQYNMLDNLKLGYGGTKTEMERLLKDAQKISGVEYNMDNLADVYDAIHVIQTEMGITGTTAKEASSTITGSVAAMKSAWTNLLGDMAVGNDITQDIDLLSESIMTAAGNVLPVVGRVVKAVPKMVTGMISKLAPQLIPMVGDIVTDVVSGVATLLPELIPVVASTAGRVIASLKGMLPGFLKIGGKLIGKMADGVIRNAPRLIPQGINAVTNFLNGAAGQMPSIISKGAEVVGAVLSGIGSALPGLLSAGMNVISSVIGGIVPMIPTLIPQGISAIMNFMQGAVGALPNVLSLGIQVLSSVGQGIVNSLPIIAAQGPVIIHDLITSVVGALPELGQAIFEGLVGILTNLPDLLAGAIKGLGGGIIDGVKSWFTDDAAATQEAGTATVESVSAGVESATPQLEAAMGASSTAAANSFATTMASKGTPQMVTEAENATTKFREPFDRIDLTSSGEMAGQGFAQGLRNSRGAIMAEAQGIANDVQNTINSSLKIHSPSLVGEESGGFYGQGLAKGLVKTRPLVRASAADLAGTVRGYADPARGSGSTTTIANNNSRTTNNSYAPQFILNMNGASATPANQRKVRKWVRDAMNESFSDLGRQAGYAMG